MQVPFTAVCFQQQRKGRMYTIHIYMTYQKQRSLKMQVNYFKQYFQDPPLICRRIMQTDGKKSLISSKVLVPYSQSKRMR